MKKPDRFDGFTVNVFLDEDGEYLAHFVELPNVSAFGESPEGALTELATAWEGVKESYKNHAKRSLWHRRERNTAVNSTCESTGGCTVHWRLRRQGREYP